MEAMIRLQHEKVEVARTQMRLFKKCHQKATDDPSRKRFSWEHHKATLKYLEHQKKYVDVVDTMVSNKELRFFLRENAILT